MFSDVEPMEVDTNIKKTNTKFKRSMEIKSLIKCKKQKLSHDTVEGVANNPIKVDQDDADVKKSKWKNKTKVLVFSSRGVSFLQRHLLKDIKSLMPHSKSEAKMEKESGFFIINEMCEMKNCNKCVFLDSRNKSDFYMWISNVPAGPSAKFVVENIYTMSELKLTGNCLKGSRSLLSFDKSFEGSPHLLLLKELFTQVFGVPNYHPKSKPFVDHVMTFSAVDDRIWVRNYQIVDENGELTEIGPRFTLNPLKIFKGSFSGETLYDNPQVVSLSSISGPNAEEEECEFQEI